jgi:ABC-type branched-subunit amino acid transport system substrate-binding protein
VTASTVTVGNVATTTGLVPGLFLGAQVGVQAYFDYINSTGGVNGRKLEVINASDALSCANNKTQTLALEPKVVAFVGQFSLFDNCGGEAIPPTIANVSNSLNPVVTKLPNTFSPQPIQNGWSTGTLLWLKQHYGKYADKVGALVGNVPSVLASWQGEQNALQKTGFKVIDMQEYGVGQPATDFDNYALKMKDMGVQIVLTDQADVGSIAEFVDAMQLEHFTPAITFNSGSSYDGKFIPDAGASAAGIVTVGLHESLYLGQDANSVPAVATFDHWINVAHPGYMPDIFSVYGWSSAELFVQALKNAGSDPNRASLLAALKNITSFNADGLLATSDPAAKTPPGCFVIAKVENGSWQRVEPSSGFECAGTYIYDNTIP